MAIRNACMIDCKPVLNDRLLIHLKSAEISGISITSLTVKIELQQNHITVVLCCEFSKVSAHKCLPNRKRHHSYCSVSNDIIAIVQ